MDDFSPPFKSDHFPGVGDHLFPLLVGCDELTPCGYVCVSCVLCRVLCRVWRLQLGQWLAKQLSQQYLGKLDKDKEARLAAIGVPWLEFTGRQRRYWWEQYEVLLHPATTGNSLGRLPTTSCYTLGAVSCVVCRADGVQELRQFYKRFRHSRVPTMWEENVRLSRWVKDQRALFCARRLSFEQIHALEQLKFDWKITYATSTASFSLSFISPVVFVQMVVLAVITMGGRTWTWTKNFKELRSFKSRYGHMHVYRWKPAHAEPVLVPH